VDRALVVNGLEGLDEISIAGPSRILDVSAGGVDEYEVHPEHFGLPAAGHDAVKGGDAARNAAIIRGILGGRVTEAEAAQRHIVALNAAAALVAAGRTADLAEGVRVATQVIDSGEALARVEAFVRMTQSFAN
jgi:anthranilate phosphoribosyltransferase